MTRWCGFSGRTARTWTAWWARQHGGGAGDLASGSAVSALGLSGRRQLPARPGWCTARPGEEPYVGKVAVAAVVLNRVKSPSFPNTIAGVVYQGGALDAVYDGQINLTPGFRQHPGGEGRAQRLGSHRRVSITTIRPPPPTAGSGPARCSFPSASTISPFKAIPHNSAAALAMCFPPSAACKTLDLPPANLRVLPLRLTKNALVIAPPHLCGIVLTSYIHFIQ